MKLLFIAANKDHSESFTTKLNYKLNSSPMLVLQQLAAAVPTEHTVQLIDDRYDNPDYNTDADIIGISVLTPSAPRAYLIADAYRNLGKTVILGGCHPSAVPEEAKQHADAVIIGDAETTLPSLIHDYSHNKLKPYYYSQQTTTSSLPEPHRNLIRIQSLFAPVITSRGCPYNCSFCTLAHLYGQIYTPRPIEEIIHEIQTIPQKILVFIHDSSLTIDPNYTKQLFKALIPLKRKFIAWGSAPVLYKNEELLQLSHQAGCLMWSFGFESFNQNSITQDAQKQYRIATYRKLIKKIHHHNMIVYGSFVFGFDHDTPDIFDTTLQTLSDYELDAAEFDILTPYPITRLYKQLEQENRILHRNWLKYDLHHVVFQPKHLTPQELQQGVQTIATQFYSPLKTLQRIIGSTKQTKTILTTLASTATNVAMKRFHKEYTSITYTEEVNT
jgi:radical SAM superfamily enzyme YgiQ (UPF0313 family)